MIPPEVLGGVVLVCAAVGFVIESVRIVREWRISL